MGRKQNFIFTAIILAIIIGFVMCVQFTHAGRAARNLWFGSIQKVDDATSYKTRKQVEDTCRAMVSSYESDKLTWEQYENSANEEKKSWAEQAKMRANKTAAMYNNFILENSYVWNMNVPDDIQDELEYIEGN